MINAEIIHHRSGAVLPALLAEAGKPILRGDVSRMVRRRASDAGIETAIGSHTFRATGDNGLSHERGAYRGRATHGRALKRHDERALRPAQR
jgi:hypothetical protein